MHETAFEPSPPGNKEQKRAALEAVLHSHTFARADQLKSFLKYVCEMELAGRGHELTEYLIGIEALGRPANYSPGDDSAVRNRAFALRKKLQEFYEHEQPDTDLRIELTKGSYCPHFVEASPHQKANENGKLTTSASTQLMPLPTTHVELLPAAPHQTYWKKSWLFAFGAGVVLTALIAGVIYFLAAAKHSSNTALPNFAPILAEAWGPLLTHNAEVLMCVANPPSFSVHSSARQMASPAITSPTPFNDPGARPMPLPLYDLYKTRYTTSADDSFSLTITTNATYWGDSLGAMTALKVLHAAGVSPQMFPEKVVTIPTLRRRNVILFGAPEYSPAVAHFLEKCPLRINYLDAIFSPETGQTPTARYSIKRDQQNRLALVFGLITVLPSESAVNQQNRTLIFSGVNSAGTQAAAEFFTSPEHLLELKKQLKKDGHETFPPAYQIVVRAETDDSILLNFRYETYRIIPNPTSH
jgi:hypothetical protein